MTVLNKSIKLRFFMNSNFKIYTYFVIAPNKTEKLNFKMNHWHLRSSTNPQNMNARR